ncbi:hypothetical protein IFU24_22540, partial [Erwinia persicina]|nr:hypothetical protein [Erwinia persicina]
VAAQTAYILLLVSRIADNNIALFYRLPGSTLAFKVPPQEPEVIQALRQLCPKLSARKQRELLDVIQVTAKPKKRGGS